MKYPDELIREIQQKSPLEEVIPEYVSLKKGGNWLKGLCPFHHEKTPSFMVNPKGQYWKCFGQCGEGGDVFDFIMKINHCSFPEAIQFLAGKAGIKLPDRRQNTPPQYDVSLLEAALTFFQTCLWESKNPALSYLRKRGLKDETIRTYGLGYAPNAWTRLLRQLCSQFKTEDMVKFGLIREHPEKKSQYDFFRHRVIIPIYNGRGKLIAFGGRILDDSMPKYLNSPESEVFKKGQTLFGFHLAKESIRKARQVFLTEGYFDPILMRQCNHPNVIGTLGTALTEDHIESLGKYADTLICLFDGDVAGKRAISRHFMKDGTLTFTKTARRLLLEKNIQVISLPLNEDPASLLPERKTEFESYLTKSVPLLHFLYDQIIAHYQPKSGMTQEWKCLTTIGTLLAQLPAGRPRLSQLEVLAEKLQMSHPTLALHFGRILSGTSPKSPELQKVTLPPAERLFIRALAGLPRDRRQEYSVDPAQMTEVGQTVISHFLADPSESPNLGAILHKVPPEYHNYVTALVAAPIPGEEADSIITDCLDYYARLSVEKELQELTRKSLQESNQGTSPLLKEKDELLRFYVTFYRTI